MSILLAQASPSADLASWLTVLVNAGGFGVLTYYFIRVAPVEREKVAAAADRVVERFTAALRDISKEDVKERQNQRLYDEARAERERKDCEERFTRLTEASDKRTNDIMAGITAQNQGLQRAVEAISRMATSTQQMSDSAIKTQAEVVKSLTKPGDTESVL